MTNLIDLQAEREKRTPHAQGKTRCVVCEHESQAVAPLGVHWMECAQCHLLKSTWVNPFRRGKLAWTCRCGCDVFGISERLIYCQHCGKEQEFST